MNSLTETDPVSIDELMSKDPLSLTKEDKSIIVQNLRAARKRWEQEETKARASGRRPNPAAGISVKDLDIQL